MIWKALMKDGRTILQEHNGVETTLKELDTDNVDIFSIIDSLSTLVHLDLCNGTFDLNNLDLQKLTELNGGETLSLVYDADQQRFKLSPESLMLLNDLILKEERANSICFDQTGKFLINGIPFYVGFEKDGVVEEFTNQPPYKNIIQINDATTDFLGSSNNTNPYKRIDSVVAHSIGYAKDHIFSTTTFNLSIVLKYEVIQKCVSLNLLITPNEDIKGKLIVFYGNNQSSLEVQLTKNETASLNRIITLM
jgi:hypothetical protein